MTSLIANLIEIFQLGSEITGILDLPAEYWPGPGQYLSCQRVSGDINILPVHLFRVLGDPDQLSLGPIPEYWQPGDPLVCSPPQGHGFSLPSTARRVGLVPYQVSPIRLLALAGRALSQGAVVSLFTDSTPPIDLISRVPSQVEVLPLSSLVNNPTWPDYLAVDLKRSALDHFSALFRPECEGDVLICTPMPCRGVGECSVCAVQTHHGWRFACVDGPVFPITEVLNVAR
jgi:dihydroorotate dehydrogenase electron transfer subunit